MANTSINVGALRAPTALSIAMALLLAAGASARLGADGLEVVAPVDDGSSLQLRVGVIDLGLAPPARGLGQAALEAAPGERFVIQLDGPMTPERRRGLEQAGVTVGDYLPTNAFVVRLDGADANLAAALPFIRWHGEFKSAWKVDPDIGGRTFASNARKELARAGQAALVITLFKDATAPEVAEALDVIAALPGAAVTGRDQIGGNEVVMARLSLPDLGAVAAIPAVQFIEEAPEISYRNDTNRWVVQSNVTNVTPLYDNGIHGEGQVLGHMDGALAQTHCSFSDGNPIGPTHRKILAYNGAAGANQHGTHTAGTAVGDAGTTAPTRGVAYLAKIVHAGIPAFSEAAMNTALTTHHNQGARVHTNSWGDDGTTSYNSLCRGVDAFSYNFEDSLVCFAVTNTSTLKNPENAKNCLAVGASQDAPSQGSFCSGGTGPTADGRRKPEIYAPGCSTNSSSGTACATAALTGTSMASPAISGAGLLARQYFVDGFHPSGAANPSDGFTPTAALIKAALLNSAVDMTAIAGFPSNQEGWGRVLLDNALFFTGDARRLIVEDVRNASGLSTGGLTTRGVNVTSSAEPLKVTLVWTEPAAASGAGNPVINDLDLEVVAPDNTTYKGNVFTGGVSTPGGVKDAKNNVEQVILASPAVGAWSVRIIGAAVNQGAQGYALVVTGGVQDGPLSLSISATNAPTVIAPGSGAMFNVAINPGDESIVGTPTVSYRYAAGAFTTQPLTYVSGTTWTASLPPVNCDDVPQFYVSAEGSVNGIKTAPPGAPASFFSALVGTTTVLFTDTIETNLGWAVNAASDDNATTGVWIRVDPVGTAAQPEDDHTNAGTICWVTGQGAVGGLVGDNDVDGGKTTVYSPVLDLSTAPEARVSYWRWYSNTAGAAPGADIFTVEVFNSVSLAWVNVETVGPTGPETSGGWTFRQFRVADFVPTTSQARVRFTASDLGAGSIIEAAVDDFQVDSFGCVSVTDPCPEDLDGDGAVTSADLGLLLGDWGVSGPADFDGDGAVGAPDLALLLGAWGPCP